MRYKADFITRGGKPVTFGALTCCVLDNEDGCALCYTFDLSTARAIAAAMNAAEVIGQEIARTQREALKLGAKVEEVVLMRNRRIFIHEGPNKEGKYLYTMTWLADDDKQRGQVFRATLPTECAQCGKVASWHCDLDEPGVDHEADCELMHHEYKSIPMEDYR